MQGTRSNASFSNTPKIPWPKAHVPAASRPYDCLYDPCNITSSERDHNRNLAINYAVLTRVKKVPVFKNMFSDIPRIPRYVHEIEPTVPVPAFVPGNWMGRTVASRIGVLKSAYLTDVPAPPPLPTFGEGEVDGKYMYRYWRRSPSPRKTRYPHPYKTAPTPVSSVIREGKPEVVYKPPVPPPPTREVEVQTQYRDGESQTEPYSPEYTYLPKFMPEILALATLTYGQGLPVRIHDLDNVVITIKRWYRERNLPGIVDPKERKERLAHETEKCLRWCGERDQEMMKVQEVSVQRLKRLLERREEVVTKMIRNVLERRAAKFIQDRIRVAKKCRETITRRMRFYKWEFRKIHSIRKEPYDILQEYKNRGSETYAPLTRHGFFPDDPNRNPKPDLSQLNSYDGLLEYEACLPYHFLRPRIKPPKRITTTEDGYLKRWFREERRLAKENKELKDARLGYVIPEKPWNKPVKKVRPKPRPPTPKLEPGDRKEELLDIAVTVIQCLIRGRSGQNKMIEEKEWVVDLIEEMKMKVPVTKEAIQQREVDLAERDRLLRIRNLKLHRQSIFEDILITANPYAPDGFDFLAKHLLRLHEDQRIEGWIRGVHWERKRREIDEPIVRINDVYQFFKDEKLMDWGLQVPYMMMEYFIEHIMNRGVVETTQMQAIQYAEEMARKINDVAYEAEKNRNLMESEAIVSNLVHSFLLPEVPKEMARSKVRWLQQRRLQEVRVQIFGVGYDSKESVVDWVPTDPVETCKCYYCRQVRRDEVYMKLKRERVLGVPENTENTENT